MNQIPIRARLLCFMAAAAGYAGIVSAVALAGPFEDGDTAYWRHDYAEALRILRPLADQGDTNAQADMGYMYLNGFGVEKNGGQAVRWFFRSADNGNPKAQAMLAHLYFSGDAGVSRDLALCAKWDRRAADQGYAEAQYDLGALYENGFGVSQDYTEAMKWSILAVSRYAPSETESRRLAAVNRDRQAEHLSLAQIAEAERRAQAWMPIAFRRTSEDDVREAGFALERKDYKTAVRLYRLRADEGAAEAQTMLGELYSIGYGVARDHKEAARLFRAAAVQGDMSGQESLALAYEEGKGVPQDDVRAYMWYVLAADTGGANVFTKRRDALAGKLTAAQLTEVQRLAAQCKASNFKTCDCGA